MNITLTHGFTPEAETALASRRAKGLRAPSEVAGAVGDLQLVPNVGDAVLFGPSIDEARFEVASRVFLWHARDHLEVIVFLDVLDAAQSNANSVGAHHD